MTEYEITKAVAEKFLPCDYRYNDESRVVEFVAIRNVNNFGIDEEVAIPYGVFDPCNNAQQAWEIMLDNDISITKDGDLNGYIAFKGLWGRRDSFDPDELCCNDLFVTNEKPFVAAMLLLLEI